MPFEDSHKRTLKSNHTTMGLAPKLPEHEAPFKLFPPMTDPHPERRSKPCNTYGDSNRCEGMTCDSDDACASLCCG